MGNYCHLALGTAETFRPGFHPRTTAVPSLPPPSCRNFHDGMNLSLWMMIQGFLGGETSNIYVIFIPKLREDSNFDAYFSNGLKPPTSFDRYSLIHSWELSHIPYQPALLKMLFFFPRREMLVSWRVYMCIYMSMYWGLPRPSSTVEN